MAFNKTLTALATAAALVAGVAYAQTNPIQPSPNRTGEPNSGQTVNNSGMMGSSGSTMGSSVDSSASGSTSAQSDIVAPEPRADRN